MSLGEVTIAKILKAAGSRADQVRKVLVEDGFIAPPPPPPPPTPQQSSGLSTYDYERAQKRSADEPEPDTVSSAGNDGTAPLGDTPNGPPGEPNAQVEGRDV